MAADLTQTFMGRHIEKIVLGAAAAAVLVAAVLFVSPLGRASRESLRGDLKAKIKQIEDKKLKTTLNEVLTPEEKKQLGTDEEPPTVDQFKKALAALPPPWPGNVNTNVVVVVTEGPKVVPKAARVPEKILAVEDVETGVGRGVTNDPNVPHAVAKMPGKNVSDLVWAVCVGRFDMTEQLAEYLKAEDEPEILITKVELQRRGLKAGGQWADWEAVPSAIPAAAVDKLPKRPASPKDRAAVYKWWSGQRDFQLLIRRAPFFPLVAADEGAVTAFDLAGEIKGLEQPRVPAPAAKPPEGEGEQAEAPPGPPPPGAPPPGTPSWAVGIGPEAKPATPAAKAAEAHVMATVWAYDASVRPGGAYQYRMRVAVFNPAYGQAGVPDEARWKLELEGGWSEPTPKVNVPELTQFYFIGTFGERANLELHRWIHGQWVVVPSVPSGIGAPVIYVKKDAKLRIPGAAGKEEEVTTTVDLSPGVLLVDMVRSFPYYPEGNKAPMKTNVLVFAGPGGTLDQRIEWDDRKAAAKARAAHEGSAPRAPTKPASATESAAAPAGAP